MDNRPTPPEDIPMQHGIATFVVDVEVVNLERLLASAVVVDTPEHYVYGGRGPDGVERDREAVAIVRSVAELLPAFYGLRDDRLIRAMALRAERAARWCQQYAQGQVACEWRDKANDLALRRKSEAFDSVERLGLTIEHAGDMWGVRNGPHSVHSWHNGLLDAVEAATKSKEDA